MRTVALVISVGWILFWVGWLVASFTAKSSTGRGRHFLAIRVALLIAAVVVVRLFGLHGNHEDLGLASNPWALGAGVALWAAGLALAVWARVYIGRNWGMPMTHRDQPELVITGPYRFIRHPIYTGIIAALVGTVLATSLYGLIAVALLSGWFIFSATREERYLAGEFPESYPGYKQSSKMLVPFVF